ncbi:Alpha/Beta hydrolase protein [Pisolithus orientalis]|uniref:Alpha/Beta hydrolase protein n=1 Tax=Pisolithus orientalis TaxID=936130 RepID=UPI0022256AE2|nr:Alpha/Beta hydrolase protein [Pisolithus orientalis]KAI5995766.1 Alpha/Beta hydrolase protein [Pisolithus orientalis]
MSLALWIKQPWKTFYLTFHVFTIALVFLPIHAVKFSFTRPRPTWSWRHAMRVALTRRLGSIATVLGRVPFDPDYHAIEPGPGVEGVWMDGVPHLMNAELKIWSSVANVTSIRIPGYWYARTGSNSKPPTPTITGQKVFLYIHGGGFTQLSAHPRSPTSIIPRSLVELTDDAPYALAVEYRLSSTYPFAEKHSFPAALLDALTGYNFLVNTMGYDPSDIVVAGDSAGGNIALALTRYLVENKGSTEISLPGPPGHLLVSSPVTDMSNSHVTPGSSALANDKDIIGDFYNNPHDTPYRVLAYVGPFGAGIASCNRYVSPASLSPLMQSRFIGFPRTFIIAGGMEVFRDQIRSLRDKMVRDMGEAQVAYYEPVDAVHDYIVFPWHPDRPATLKAIQEWLVSG